LPVAASGHRGEVITVQRNVDTPAPREQVAAYLSDFSTSAEWDPNTKACRQVDDGPVQVGTRFDNVQKVGPGSTTLRYRVVEYTPGRTVELHSDGSLLTSKDRMDFADAADGGTRVSYTARLSLKGPARVAEPLLRRAMDRVADRAAECMERRLARLTPAG
jgi:carbon monoxide dehydrogenase subunit G